MCFLLTDHIRWTDLRQQPVNNIFFPQHLLIVGPSPELSTQQVNVGFSLFPTLLENSRNVVIIIVAPSL